MKEVVTSGSLTQSDLSVTPNYPAGSTGTWVRDELGFRLTIVAGAGGAVGGPVYAPFGLTFNVYDLTNHSAVINLFDQYSIRKVNVAWYGVPQGSTSAIGVPIAMSSRLVVARDYNYAVPPSANSAGLDLINGFSTVKNVGLETGDCAKPILIQSFRPTTLTELMGFGGTVLPAGNASKRWISTVNDTVPHFGLRGMIYFQLPNLPANGIFEIIVTPKVTYYLDFKNVR